jgi:hypothetical protein
MLVSRVVISTEHKFRYVFVNAENVVVQSIDGDLSEDDLAVFMRDYSILFEATEVFATDPALGIMGGWVKNGDVYIPPTLEPTLEP